MGKTATAAGASLSEKHKQERPRSIAASLISLRTVVPTAVSIVHVYLLSHENSSWSR